jgi:hypothetical protein
MPERISILAELIRQRDCEDVAQRMDAVQFARLIDMQLRPFLCGMPACTSRIRAVDDASPVGRVSR